MNLKQSVGKEKSTGDIQNLEVVPLAIQWHRCFHSGTWSLGNPGNLADKFAQKSLESTFFRGYVSFREGNPWNWSKQKQHGKHPTLPIFSLDVCFAIAPGPTCVSQNEGPWYLGCLVWKPLVFHLTLENARSKWEILGKFNNHACNNQAWNHQTCKLMMKFAYLFDRGVFVISVPRVPNGLRPCSDCWGQHPRATTQWPAHTEGKEQELRDHLTCWS